MDLGEIHVLQPRSPLNIIRRWDSRVSHETSELRRASSTSLVISTNHVGVRLRNIGDIRVLIQLPLILGLGRVHEVVHVPAELIINLILKLLSVLLLLLLTQPIKLHIILNGRQVRISRPHTQLVVEAGTFTVLLHEQGEVHSHRSVLVQDLIEVQQTSSPFQVVRTATIFGDTKRGAFLEVRYLLNSHRPVIFQRVHHLERGFLI